QGQSNNETAKFNSNINRVDQVGPNGSTTWTIKPGADPNNPKPGDYVQTSLSAPQQQLLDQGNKLSLGLADVASSSLNRVGQGMATPFDTSKIGTLNTSGVDTSTLRPLAGGGSYADQVKSVQDAVYSRMQPQLQRNRADAETRLLNSG